MKVVMKGFEPPVSKTYYHWEKGIAELSVKNCEKAHEYFSMCQSLKPNDVMTEYYLEGCSQFIESPEEYSLVLTMETK